MSADSGPITHCLRQGQRQTKPLRKMATKTGEAAGTISASIEDMAAVFALVAVPMAFCIMMLVSSMTNGTMSSVIGVGLIAGMAALFYGLLRFVVRFEEDEA